MKKILAFLISIFLYNGFCQGNISLPEIFANNMVLQQNSEVVLWGWANTGETVSLKADWMDQEISVKSNNQGQWKLIFHTPVAGGPYTIKLKGYNEIILSNVLIGEVWICSGQSNMEWTPKAGIVNGAEEIKNADFPQIRLFNVAHATADYPQDHLSGTWSQCNPENMSNFSAIGYTFAKKLYQELKVPIGIINASWGGTAAEAWTSADAIQRNTLVREAASRQKPVPWGPVEPGRIYNAMIHPIIPFRIAGTIWYQGEANTINGYAYKEILTNLITDWRTSWGYDFPFYFAQIAPYKYGTPQEGVIVRDAQRRTLELNNTGMAILSDIGDTSDIHPRNKIAAGLRFAGLALHRYYHVSETEDCGPLYKSMVIEQNKVILTFDHSEGLYCTGKKLMLFEVAGKDGIYYPADAKIKGSQIEVSSRLVKEPISVRFAWSNTATPNLFNGAHLPASSFITQ